MTNSLANNLGTVRVSQPAQYAPTTPQPQSPDTTSRLSKTSGPICNAVIIYRTPTKAVAVVASPKGIEEAYTNAVKSSKIYIAKKTPNDQYEIVELPKIPEVCPTCGPKPTALQAIRCLGKSAEHTYLYSEIFWKSPLFTEEPRRYHATNLPRVSDLFARILRGERYTFDPIYIFKDSDGNEHVKFDLFHDKDPIFCSRFPGPNPKSLSVLIGVDYFDEPLLNADWQTWFSKSGKVQPLSCRAIKGVAQLHPLCQPATKKLKNIGRAGLMGTSLAVSVGTGTLLYRNYRSQPSAPSIDSSQPVSTRSTITDEQYDAYATGGC
jgi:hypothetical protein